MKANVLKKLETLYFSKFKIIDKFDFHQSSLYFYDIKHILIKRTFPLWTRSHYIEMHEIWIISGIPIPILKFLGNRPVYSLKTHSIDISSLFPDPTLVNVREIIGPIVGDIHISPEIFSLWARQEYVEVIKKGLKELGYYNYNGK